MSRPNSLIFRLNFSFSHLLYVRDTRFRAASTEATSAMIYPDAHKKAILFTSLLSPVAKVIQGAEDLGSINDRFSEKTTPSWLKFGYLFFAGLFGLLSKYARKIRSNVALGL